MKRLMITIGILVSSYSFAAPLIGTKQSVNESNFCKKYKCVFLSNDHPEGAPEGWKQYIYSLSGQGQLTVLRNVLGVIISSTIQFEGNQEFSWAFENDGAYTNDYALSFMGMKPNKSLKDVCLNDVIAEGTPPVSAGIMGEAGNYFMRCIASVKTDSAYPAITSATMMIIKKY